MTAKDKAKELVDKYWNYSPGTLFFEDAKECALIAVDEMINYLLDSDWALINNKAKYWQEVKQEIQNL
jgi:predicted SPOUT superfamily RNA methylase MTH1